MRARLAVRLQVEFGNFGCNPAFEVAFDNPALNKARVALGDEWGKKAVTVGAGGSIPIVGDFKTVLGMDTLMVGFALDDDRVHSPNEKSISMLPQGHPQLGADFSGAGGLRPELEGGLFGRGCDQARTDKALQPAGVA